MLYVTPAGSDLFLERIVHVYVCVCPHCLTVQLLVDLDDPTEWVNEELVVSVPTDNGIKDGSIQLTVHILCYQLQTHTHMRVTYCQRQSHILTTCPFPI